MTNEPVVEIVTIAITHAVAAALVVIKSAIIHIHEVLKSRVTVLVLRVVLINMDIIKDVVVRVVVRAVVRAVVQAVALVVVLLAIHAVRLVSHLEETKVLAKKRVLERILVLGTHLLENLQEVIVPDLHPEIEVYLLRSHLSLIAFSLFVLFSFSLIFLFME